MSSKRSTFGTRGKDWHFGERVRLFTPKISTGFWAATAYFENLWRLSVAALQPGGEPAADPVRPTIIMLNEILHFDLQLFHPHQRRMAPSLGTDAFHANGR